MMASPDDWTRDARAALPPSLQTAVAPYQATPVNAGESQARVWRLTAPGRPTLFLKTGADRAADDVAAERARLAWLAGRLRVPEVRGFERTTSAAHLLTTAVEGTTAYDCLASTPHARDAILSALAAYLRDLHALPVAECPFDAGHVHRLAAARLNLDAGCVDEDDFDEARAGWSAAQVWDEMTALLPLPFASVVTHGDFSLDNVLLADGRVSGGIDWGRAGVADPYQDLAIMARDLAEFGGDTSRAFLRMYGIAMPDDRKLRFFECLDEFF